MIILGIDPGLRTTGFGVIEADAGRAGYVASGCIRTVGANLPERLRVIFEGVQALIEQHRPDQAAIESVFVQRNVSSALKLGQARGAAICAMAVQGVPVHEYTPAQIKQSVVGLGAADKHQVRHMICALLRLSAAPRLDASDALACAISHLHAGGIRSRLRPGSRARGRVPARVLP